MNLPLPALPIFPVDNQFHNSREYRDMLAKARTMKELYSYNRQGIDEASDILSLKYVFYSPGRGG